MPLGHEGLLGLDQSAQGERGGQQGTQDTGLDGLDDRCERTRRTDGGAGEAEVLVDQLAQVEVDRRTGDRPCGCLLYTSDAADE